MIEIIIKKLVIKVGTSCSLRCEKCGEFNPYLENSGKRFLLTAESLSNDVFRVLSAVDKIETIHVAGGEPFLHKDLFQLLAFLNCCTNIDNIEVVTNGTVFPDDILLSTLNWVRKKVIVLISDYTAAGIDNKEFSDKLIDYNIRYKLQKDMVWKDKSDTSFKDYCEAELINIAEKCPSFRQSYFSLIDGILTSHCPTSGSILHYLGLHDNAKNHFVSIRDMSIEDLKSRLAELNDHSYTPMCNWCVPTYNAPDCLAGAQLN